MADEHTETKLVYCGHMLSRSAGKVSELWATLEAVQKWLDDEGEGQWIGRIENLNASVFKANRSEPLIGGIYKVEAIINEGRPVSIKSRKSFVEVLQAASSKLYAASKAVDVQVAADRKLADLKSNNPLMNDLKRLREVYRTASPENRMALEVVVLKALRNGL